jgi:hypothetical protein
MTRLDNEHQRLYRWAADGWAADPSADDRSADDAGLAAGDDSVRAAALTLSAPADWSLLSAVWRGVQAELGLPAPAIAVSGLDGYQLWFSFAHRLPSAQAQDFVDALQARYLPEVAPRRIATLPAAERHDMPLPPLQTRSAAGDERWSAFVAPDLAPVFADTPWLDTLPNPDGQADVLSRLRSITPDELLAARIALGLDAPAPLPASAAVAAAAVDPAAGNATTPSAAQTQTLLYPLIGHANPRAFLQAVMNDPTVALALRIDAAKALL